MSRPVVLIVSSSSGFLAHAKLAFGPSAEVRTVCAARKVIPSTCDGVNVIVVHASAMEGEDRDASLERLRALGVPLAVAADVPDLREMLELSRHDIRGYFNSYMADVHCRQLVSMLAQGLTWFSPPLMRGALDLARASLGQDRQLRQAALDPLTKREREIAVDVASGLTNREIAEERSITERTVKAHLTRIFRKLGTRNRHALAMKLRGS